MRKIQYLFFGLFLLPMALRSQQLPDRSPFGEMAFVWNPAMTALYNYWELGAGFRQQWVGFKDAPQTTTLSVQYPIEKQNASLGGFYMNDAIRPIKSNAFAFTYAYKASPGFKRGDQLSIGIMVSLTHVFLDGLDLVVNDEDDELLPSGENNKVSPNAGLGVFYTNNARDPFDKNSLFAGIGFNQLIPVNLAFVESGTMANLKRVLHGNAVFGARIVNKEIMLEPSLWVNYSAANLLNANLSLRMEKRDAFWAGLTYTTNQTVAIQVGSIFTKGLAKDGTIRAGLLGSYNIGSFGRARGVGYECYIAYRFEL